MEHSKTVNAGVCEINFTGNFGFDDNEAINSLIGQFETESATKFIIDLSNLQNIDSAGLGMLILINDAIKEMGKTLQIRSPQGQVSKMLDISRFSEIMPII